MGDLARDIIMSTSFLHHVSLASKNVAASVAFYRDRLGFQVIPRPGFNIAGAWLNRNAVEIHLIDRPDGTYRQHHNIDTDDVHFAMRVDSIETLIAELKVAGFREDVDMNHPLRMLVKRNSMAGYHQVYVHDPDGHMIEINAP